MGFQPRIPPGHPYELTMKITMIGTGYVGLVTGTCFADSGNDVTCVDIDQKKIEPAPWRDPHLRARSGRACRCNIADKRLHFTTDLASAVKSAKLVFLAVGTPSAHDGSADLSNLWAVVEAMAPHLPEKTVVVTKSTVPVGTNAGIFSRLKKATGATAWSRAIPSSSRKERRSTTSPSPTAWSWAFARPRRRPC